MSKEQLFYDTLKHIAKDYASVDELKRTAESRYGLAFEEALEFAYENIRNDAATSIKGLRRPK